MSTRIRIPAFLLTLVILFISISFSQESPNGDPAEVRSAILNSNNITTALYNYGSITRPNTGGNVYDFVWRGLGYMYEFAPLLAGEVIGVNGDTLRFVDDGLWLPSQGDYSPGGLKWGWLPRAGYARSGQGNLATSNNPASWPTSWTQWPGEFGSGVVIGRDEAYFAMDDFTNAEFPYYPFPTDSTKRGLGVSCEMRVYQFGGGLSDAVIIKYKLKNESPRALNKLYFGYYGDPHIGGPNSFNDDHAGFIGPEGPPGDPLRFLSRNTNYHWDLDGRGDGGLPTGYLGIKLLSAPGPANLTAGYSLPFGGLNFPSNDNFYYWLLSRDSIERTPTTFPGDWVTVFGSGPFSLMPGESTFVALAVFLSENYQDMLDDASYMHFVWHWPNISGGLGQQGGDQAYRTNLTSPSSGVVSGSVPITWQYLGSDPNAKVLVECSFDRGNSWKAIAWNHPVGQQLTWNTTEFRDGVNYSLRIVAHSADLSRYYYDVSDQRFTVNNPVNAQPELRLNLTFEGTVVRNPPLNIFWTAEDADNPNLTVTLSYAFSSSGPFTQFHSASYPSGDGGYAWDFTNAPNAATYYLKVTASDGNKDSVLVSRSFTIDQERGHYEPTTFQHIAGKATPDFRLQVINPLQLTRHPYEISFAVPHPDSTKRFTIRDLTTGVNVISNYVLSSGFSTPQFDGLKLTIIDKPTDINLSKSKFNRSALDSTKTFTWTNVIVNRVKVPYNWYLAFNSMDTLPNGRYVYPGDTVFNNSGRRVVVCPFKIFRADSVQSGIALVANAFVDSLWRPGRPLVLFTQQPQGLRGAYQVNMNFTATLRPTFGDTLWIVTDKPITAQDVFRFVADSNFVTGVVANAEITTYKLWNNYPNPFNPTTTIRYDLPHTGKVTLKVYDILGREVQTLVDEVQVAGGYAVQVNAVNLASGVYFYRLQTENFVSVKRMMLLR